jgi:hypothetical protein
MNVTLVQKHLPILLLDLKLHLCRKWQATSVQKLTHILYCIPIIIMSPCTVYQTPPLVIDLFHKKSCGQLLLQHHCKNWLTFVLAKLAGHCRASRKLASLSNSVTTSTPFRNHLQGGFHPAFPPLQVAGWKLPHPALLPAMFASVAHSLRFACSWITLNNDPTVWLDGARLANTCILSSFPWMAPAHHPAYPPLKGAFPPQLPWLPGYAVWV